MRLFRINTEVFLIVVLIVFSFLSAGCGSSGSSGSGVSEVDSSSITPDTINILSTENLSSDYINPGDSSNVYATVYSANGNTIAGQSVLFTLDNPTLGFITSSAATDGSGVAAATFTARSRTGQVQITATAGTIENDQVFTINIIETAVAKSIELSASPQELIVRGTSTITATVKDAQGALVQNGTTVNFDVENTESGTISVSATTNGGVATATFQASVTPGIATIVASSGTASRTIPVTVSDAPATSIEFDSADPQIIALQGTAGAMISIIKFIVKDSNGDPLSGENVSIQMAGPNGGEYIDPSGDGTPDQIDVSTDAGGIAQVQLVSGTYAGPVTIRATINPSGIPITVQAPVVSIGGGMPSAKWFSLSAGTFNLPGFKYNDEQTLISAYLADRFGNYNVLDGTEVSFACEVGLALFSGEATNVQALVTDGTATVVARTQQPIYSGISAPEDVAPLAWETALQTYVFNTYGVSTGNPRDGVCDILVYTKGEEHYVDGNMNGMYDAGEFFIDTVEEPFIDYNGNGTYDDGTLPLGNPDPQEIYIDAIDDGVWTGKNGQWDSNKFIFGHMPILITGSPIVLFQTVDDGFSIPDGGSQTFKLLVCDRNLNTLTSGSKLSVSKTAGAGTLSGNKSYLYADTNAVGPDAVGQLGLIEYEFILSDSDSGDTDAAEITTVEAKVTWDGVVYTAIITGTVD